MVPDFEEFILATLKVLGDGKIISLQQLRISVSDYFKFSKEDLAETTRSGNNTKVVDRITWALTYLCQAGLAERPQRSFAKITFSGMELLENPPAIITREYLVSKYPSFRDFTNRKRKQSSKSNDKEGDSEQSLTTGLLEFEKQLKELKSAISTIEKMGLTPSIEMLTKLGELEMNLITSQLYPSIFSAIEEIAKSNDFVLTVIAKKGNVYFDYSNDISVASEHLANAIPYEGNASKAKKRRPNLNFYQMGLIDGDVLTFVSNENIHATIVSENKVEYNGKEYSLTKLTQELKGLDHAIQPTGEWRLEDQNLLDLYNETYS
ncbi:winged helix-turn-helix domain-containing protein [uncultured Bacteroides sp.]|uniref:winged helix-turn-helix domain-containing protein n=1 Tax=uncultured Bacteroides sp. TaxID=162156 RepID=UPI00266EB0A2|nr:winged helix-turn-helix domain-containing protein [uncultured Bacteroides sp.]